MASSSSKNFSTCGESLIAQGDYKASSRCGTSRAAEEDLGALLSGEGASAEEDGVLTACSAAISKSARHAVSETSSSGTTLDVGLWSMLDDHLLEMIFVRLTFKSLFQVSSLSKTWRLRFRSHSFQSEIHSWKSYSPLFVNHRKELVGYESGSKQWHRLPTHCYLQQNVVKHWRLMAGAGSLLCWVQCPNRRDWGPNRNDWGGVFHIHVTNPLTRSWKQLPCRPNMQPPKVVYVGWEEGSKAYKVIIGALIKIEPAHGVAWIRVQIFDSTDDSWTIKSYRFRRNGYVSWGGSAFINGVLYILVLTSERSAGYRLIPFDVTSERSAGYRLISFDVKRKIWNEIPDLCLVVDEDQEPHQVLKFSEVKYSNVSVCGSNVMLVVVHIDRVSNMDFDRVDSGDQEHVYRGTTYVYRRIMSVFKLDLERGLAVEVSRARDEILSSADTCLRSSTGQDDSIFFRCQYPKLPSTLYDVGTQEWHSVNFAEDLAFSGVPVDHWLGASATYQPGLNPFLEV